MPARPFTYSISTMGCKANLTDSHALEATLQNLGGRSVAEGQEPDLHLLNTCTVTDQADKEAKHLLRVTQSGLTIATGCLAEVDPDVLVSAIPEGRKVKVLRNSGKWELENLVASWLAGEMSSESIVAGDRAAWHGKILENRPPQMGTGLESGAHRTRAFLKVQDGCNAFCSYCVIPFARGRSRSVPAADIVAEVNKLTEAGVKEVVLTAIHAADYESLGLDFTGLVAKVLAETSMPRIRLTSLDPAEIPDSLIELMQREPRLCPHFHVSLQSANSAVLRDMKRGYSAEQVEERLSAIAARLPHAYVGMDVIAGFPTEGDSEFEDSYARLERLPWTRAHVFPFSVRRNTLAAKIVKAGSQVAREQIFERASRLRALGDSKLRASMQSKVGSVMEVLIEEKKVKVGTRTCSQGHARNYHRVLIPADCRPNELVRARIVGVGERDFLKGELL
ncbi:MAG: MiaB/RimO family radical SAM methylthiotransferase [Bdellovibrionota bacterium]